MAGGLYPPIEVIASWKINYTNPVRAGHGLVVLAGVLLALAYVVVAMRLYARYRVVKSAGIDDALILFNMIPLTGLAVSVILAVQNFGFDRHVWDLMPNTLIQARKMTIYLETLYMVSTCTTKISILLFYRRLASGTVSRAFQWALYLAMASVIMYYITFQVLMFTSCRPFHAYWKLADYFWLMQNKDKFQCWDEGVILVASAIVSAVQDFIACGLPMILFWKLRISVRQKIALGGIFALGFFLCVCSVLRIIYIFRVYYDTYDMTWESRPAWMWLTIEAHVAVMCASAPALKIFFRQALNNTSGLYGLRRSSYIRQPKNISQGSDESNESELSRLPTEKGIRFKPPPNRIGKLGTWDVTYDDERYSELEREMQNYQSKAFGGYQTRTWAEGNARQSRQYP